MEHVACGNPILSQQALRLAGKKGHISWHTRAHLPLKVRPTFVCLSLRSLSKSQPPSLPREKGYDKKGQ